MKAETEPITPDEWLLRIVWHERFRSAKVPLVSPAAFEPRGPTTRHPDHTGISLYRLACLARPADVLANLTADKRPLNGVVGVQLLDLIAPGLTAVIETELIGANGGQPIPGHVIVPELRWELFAAQRPLFTPILLALATAASRDECVFVRPTV